MCLSLRMYVEMVEIHVLCSSLDPRICLGDIPIPTNDDLSRSAGSPTPNEHPKRRTKQILHPFITHSPPSSTTGSSTLKEKMSVLQNLVKFYLTVPMVMLSSSLAGYLSPIPSLRFWSRAVTCYCSLLLCASYGVIASILLRAIGKPTLSQWTVARSFFYITSPLIGWEWDIQGEEILHKTRPVIFISNHQRYQKSILWKRGS